MATSITLLPTVATENETQTCPQFCPHPITVHEFTGPLTGPPSQKRTLLPATSKDVATIQCISDCLTLEICAGSAGLSSALRARGFQTLPVDHNCNRHEQQVACTQIDLTADYAESLIMDIINCGQLVYCHIAPPCGTATKARERRVPMWMQQLGAPDPLPLRSSAHPRGLPSLSGLALAKVLSANTIYDITAKAIFRCIELDILVSCENPVHSYMWEIPPFPQLLDHPKLESNIWSGCMHGGLRDKVSRWLASKGLLTSMALLCNMTIFAHTHLPWSLNRLQGKWTFATAEEAAYPKLQNERVAENVLQAVMLKGFSSSATALTQEGLSEVQKRLKARASVGKQPRGRRLPPLISEYAEVVETTVKPAGELQKLLRQFLKVGLGGTQPTTHYVVGILRDPVSFLEEAVKTKHPMDMPSSVPDITKVALFKVLTTEVTELVRTRCMFIKKLATRRTELSLQEKSLHESMPPHLRSILQGKQLLLLKETLAEYKYEDTLLVDDIVAGFDVVGKAPSSKVLQKRLLTATITPKELQRRSKHSRKALILKHTNRDLTSLDTVVWDSCIEEANKHWISKPLEEEDVDVLHPHGWCAIHRFGLSQKDKTRIIDDCKEPNINDAFTSVDKLALMDVDSLAAIYRFLFDSVCEAGIVTIQLDNGEVLTAPLASHLRGSRFPQFMGRLLDLKSAYKQLGGSNETLWASILFAMNPSTGKVAFFESWALMFGATSSVYAFNRCSRALWFLATNALHLIITCFYDDFPCTEPSTSARAARSALEAFMKVLGWEYAEAEHKSLPFSNVYNPLGVTVDLSNMERGIISISNKSERIIDLIASIDSLMERSEPYPGELHALHGKMIFAMAQVCGRAAVPAIRCISRHVKDFKPVKNNKPLSRALLYLKDALVTSKPRQISFVDETRPVVILTDAASEENSTTYGVLIVDTATGERLVAGGDIPEGLVKWWRIHVGQQIIGQAELFPIIVVRAFKGLLWENRRVLFYVDNDSARDAMIKAYSPSLASQNMIYSFFHLEKSAPSYPWFARVPSSSNIADWPTRGKLQQASELGKAKIFELTWTEELLASFVEEVHGY